MAKLNIKAENENGTIKSVSGNKIILIALNIGNLKVADIILETLKNGYGLCLRVSNKIQDNAGRTIFIPQTIKETGKKQQGENLSARQLMEKSASDMGLIS